eukprot:5536151-Amphidinium_carterae.1
MPRQNRPRMRGDGHPNSRWKLAPTLLAAHCCAMECSRRLEKWGVQRYLSKIPCCRKGDCTEWWGEVEGVLISFACPLVLSHQEGEHEDEGDAAAAAVPLADGMMDVLHSNLLRKT